MSTLKANAAQIGQSATATNNFTLYQPTVPDGTVRLGVGNSGSVTDIVTLTSGGGVGINNTSPANTLSVGNGTADTRIVANPNNAFAIGVSNSAGFAGWIGGTGVTDNMVFSNSGGAERMRITSAGALCLNTSATLGAKFVLHGASGGTDSYIQITNPGYGTGTFGVLGTSSNVKIYNSYTAGTLGTGAGIDIDISGNVMVGTTSPQSGASGGGANVLTLNSGSNKWGVGPTVTFGNFYIVNSANNGVFLSSGSTAWSATSDERSKDIIEPITNATEKVSSLRAVIGKYKTDADGVRRAFLIAQDVQAVLPEAVNMQEDEQGTLGLQYTDTIPLLVAAIKEQQAIIGSLKARLDAANL